MVWTQPRQQKSLRIPHTFRLTGAPQAQSNCNGANTGDVEAHDLQLALQGQNQVRTQPSRHADVEKLAIDWKGNEIAALYRRLPRSNARPAHQRGRQRRRIDRRLKTRPDATKRMRTGWVGAKPVRFKSIRCLLWPSRAGATRSWWRQLISNVRGNANLQRSFSWRNLPRKQMPITYLHLIFT